MIGLGDGITLGTLFIGTAAIMITVIKVKAKNGNGFNNVYVRKEVCNQTTLRIEEKIDGLRELLEAKLGKI